MSRTGKSATGDATDLVSDVPFDVDVTAPNLVDIVLSNLAVTGAIVLLDGFERLLEYSQRSLDLGSLGVSGAADRLFGPKLGLGIASSSELRGGRSRFVAG